jgi:exonuclease III
VLFGSDPSTAVRRQLSGITWNVNGVAKIRLSEPSIELLREVDFVFVQETYSRSEQECLAIDGFTGHHSFSAASFRKPRWGVSSLFKIETFALGSITRWVFLRIVVVATPSNKNSYLAFIY